MGALDNLKAMIPEAASVCPVSADWQSTKRSTPSIREAFGHSLPAVKSSEDLTRIINLPSRPPEQVGTLRAEALIELMTQRLGRNNPNCQCQAKYKRPCIKRLTFAQAWALYEAPLAGGLLGSLAVGSGKCVGPDTEVFDALHGRRRRVDEPGELTVCSMLGGGSLAYKRASAFASGTKACVKLRLADGGEVVLSKDHPVFTGRGWVNAADIGLADLVAVPRVIPEPTQCLELEDDEVALVALLLADGSCTTRTLGFSDDNPAVLAELTRLANKFANQTSKGVWEDTKGVDVREVRGHLVMLSLRGMTWFKRKWDLNYLSKHRRVPATFWALPNSQIRIFLNRFIACDGHVNERQVEICLASEGLIDDLRFMLLRLGVMSRKAYKLAKCSGKEFDAWRLTVSGNNVDRLFDEIGLVLGIEDRCRSLIETRRKTVTNTNVDVVPISYDEVSKICDEMGWPGVGRSIPGSGGPRTAFRKSLGATRGQWVGRDNFKAACGRVGYTGSYAWLGSSDLAWERVREVQDVGPQQVYDLSVPSTHNFVGNNIVLHNTLTDILTPMVMPDCKLAVLLVPPGLVGQLVNEYLVVAEHFRVPSLIAREKGYIVSGAPALHVVPYSRLCREEATILLDQLKPDLIIGDEAHKLKARDTSTTSRVLRYFVDHPETRLCVWSGTLTSKSIKDYGHLSALSLREKSPLPLEPNVLEEWATAIDPSDWPAPDGALDSLKLESHEHIHTAFHRRLVNTRGVVATTSGSADASIIITELKAPPIPKELQEMLRVLRDKNAPGGWTRPDGEELVDVLEVAACARQLAVGVYYRWRFPNNEPTELIDHWFAVRKVWHKELRERLMNKSPHMDSPLLCAKAAMRAYQGCPPPLGTGEEYRGDLPVWHADNWPAWFDVRDSVYHETEAVWVSDFLAKNAAEWAMSHRGVVWYDHHAFGARVAKLAGLPLHGGGPGAEQRILAEKGDRSIIASIHAHGTGRDGLQYLFNEQLIAEPPSDGATFEQVLGRLHRLGQKADEVTTYVYRHTPEFRQAIDEAIRRAKYIQATMGSQQKLLAADIDFELGDD